MRPLVNMCLLTHPSSHEEAQRISSNPSRLAEFLIRHQGQPHCGPLTYSARLGALRGLLILYEYPQLRR
jgi:hypothetical protein